MAKITALVHANNDALRIGRALDSLRSCDEIIVVDHASTDETAKIAREHGATVKPAVPGVQPGAYVIDAKHDWILCLQPNEALSESLEASLLEWKENEPPEAVLGYCADVWDEADGGWQNRGKTLRLVNRTRLSWPDPLPPSDCLGPELAGEIRRFRQP